MVCEACRYLKLLQKIVLHSTKALVWFCIYMQANQGVCGDNTQNSQSARPLTPAFAGHGFIPASYFLEKTNNPLKL